MSNNVMKLEGKMLKTIDDDVVQLLYKRAERTHN